MSKSGFTILEVIVVTIIVGAILGFAIPRYVRAVALSYRDDAIRQLSAVHTANNLYHAAKKAYWPLSAAVHDKAAINTNLGLNIIESGMTYTCSGSAGGATFTCQAVRNGPAASFTVTVTQADLSSTNPQCTAGACP